MLQVKKQLQTQFSFNGRRMCGGAPSNAAQQQICSVSFMSFGLQEASGNSAHRVASLSEDASHRSALENHLTPFCFEKEMESPRSEK